jgi:hypothetical protein
MRCLAFVLLFASACGPRCLEADVHVTGTSGQLRVVLEQPLDYVFKIDPETQLNETKVRVYSQRRTLFVDAVSDGDTKHVEWCDTQTRIDEYLDRLSAWIEPADADPIQCDDRGICPPAGAPYAETLFPFLHEGKSPVALTVAP